jgi:hypothetical protein
MSKVIKPIAIYLPQFHPSRKINGGVKVLRNGLMLPNKTIFGHYQPIWDFTIH